MKMEVWFRDAYFETDFAAVSFRLQIKCIERAIVFGIGSVNIM